jgi:hypothetical protein
LQRRKDPPKKLGEMGDRKVIKEVVMKKEPRLARGFLREPLVCMTHHESVEICWANTP